jgi:hypothetical protein
LIFCDFELLSAFFGAILPGNLRPQDKIVHENFVMKIQLKFQHMVLDVRSFQKRPQWR